MDNPKLKIFNICLIILSALCLMFSSCSSWESRLEDESNATGKADKTSSNTILPGKDGTEAPAPSPTTDLSGYAINPFTGIRNMDKSNEGKRPVAIMISNIKKATPQAGITECDMFYEIPAEGGITRIMGIFADVSKVPTIGPIRSARDYYVQIAAGYNSIFAHYGTSTSAKAMLDKNSINNLDGMYLSSSFWRDPVRKAQKGLEHSAMTSGDKLLQAISSKKYKTEGGVNGGSAFSFYSQDDFKSEGTMDGGKVTVKFSGSYVSEFKYDPSSKQYGKSQFGVAHTDENGKQIKATNVIVIYTKMSVVSDEGHLSVDLSSGNGYCLSGGKCREIKWTKGSISNPIKYMNSDGTELKVNAGKTYVCIVDSNNKITVSKD